MIPSTFLARGTMLFVFTVANGRRQCLNYSQIRPNQPSGAGNVGLFPSFQLVWHIVGFNLLIDFHFFSMHHPFRSVSGALESVDTRMDDNWCFEIHSKFQRDCQINKGWNEWVYLCVRVKDTSYLSLHYFFFFFFRE